MRVRVVLCMLALIRATLIATSQAQQYITAGNNIIDTESQYDFWTQPHIKVLFKTEDTKTKLSQKTPGPFDPTDKTLILLGHGYASQVGSWAYDELFELFDKYDRVLILACGQKFEDAEKQLLSTKLLKLKPANAQGKYLDCLKLDSSSGQYTMGNQKKCAWMTQKEGELRKQWLNVEQTFNDYIKRFRQKVVFMTPGVLNMVLPSEDNAKTKIWLTPSDEQAIQMGFSKAKDLGWDLKYNGVSTYDPAPNLGAPETSRTPTQISQFRAGNENLALLNQLKEKQQLVEQDQQLYPPHQRLAKQHVQLVDLDIDILSALPPPFNGVPEYARQLSRQTQSQSPPNSPRSKGKLSLMFLQQTQHKHQQQLHQQALQPY